jgi:hypothetical protein
MKNSTFAVITLIILGGCSSFKKFAQNKEVKGVYLHTFFYISSPFGVDEYNVEFIDSSTLVTYRITNNEDVEKILVNLLKAKESKGFHYQDLWIGMALATEKERMKVGITKEGYIKKGGKYYTMTEELASLILSILHPRLKVGIPDNTIWGKVLSANKVSQ